MTDPDRQKFGLPFVGFLLACLAAAGIWMTRPPIFSVRSDQRPSLTEPLLGEQQYASRLWQDPFEVLDASRGNTTNASPTGLSDLARQIAARLHSGQGVKLLTVMVDGGPYVEQAEARLRWRRAMLSALGTGGWRPVDAEHIGVLEVVMPRHLATNTALLPIVGWGADRETCDFPFEWLRRNPEGVFRSTTNALFRLEGLAAQPAPTNLISEPDETTAVGPTQEVSFIRSMADDLGTRSQAVLEKATEARGIISEWQATLATHRDVLVIWLNSQAFRRQPLHRLRLLDRSLRAAVGKHLMEAPETFLDTGTLEHTHLGMFSSDNLVGFVADTFSPLTFAGEESGAGSTNAMVTPTPTPPLRIFDCRATAPDFEILLRAVGPQLGERGVLETLAKLEMSPRDYETHGSTGTNRALIKKLLAQAGVDYRSFVATDEYIARALLAELNLRGTGFQRTNDWIVLVSEYDTQYGSSFQKTFQRELVAMGRPMRETSHSVSGSTAPLGFRQYGYLRGTDGERPSGTPQELAAVQEGKSGDRDATLRSMATREWAVGPPQFDYLRRVADEVGRLDYRLRRDHHSGVKAVGIIGTDLHDKLSVLQALRPRLPQATFFTTDLDVRFLNRQQKPWTRNLVVAASHGLRLSDDLQPYRGTFRESYQTSLYLACLAATGQTNILQRARYIPPLLFEIGERRIVPFHTNQYSHPVTFWAQANEPERAPARFAVKVAFVLLTMLLFVVWMRPAFISDCLRKVVAYLDDGKSFWRRSRTTWWAWFGGLLAVSFSIWYLCRMHQATSWRTGEPFFFFEGVSVWPTNLLRLLVLCISVGFLSYTLVELPRNWRRVSREFGFEVPEPVRRKRLLQCVEAGWGEGGLARLPDRLRKSTFIGRVSAMVHALNRLVRGGASSMTRLWLQSSPQPGPDREDEPGALGQPEEADQVWRDYAALGRCWSRFRRVLLGLVLYLALCVVLLNLTASWPESPVRSPRDYVSVWEHLSHPTPFVLDLVCGWVSGIAQVALLLFAFDATHLCRHFIRAISPAQGIWPGWPEDTYHRDRTARRLPAECRKHWISVQIIAKRSRAVLPVICVPFITLALTIISRSKLFDRYHWTPGLVLILGLSALLAVWAVVQLRSAAESARKHCLQQLSDLQVRLAGSEKSEARGQVGLLINSVKEERRGAFAPLTEQPLLKALLLPSGSLGMLWILDLLAMA